jgi:hypothetical protein
MRTERAERLAMDKWIEGNPFDSEIEWDLWMEDLWEHRVHLHLNLQQPERKHIHMLEKWAERLYGKGVSSAEAARIMSRAFQIYAK